MPGAMGPHTQNNLSSGYLCSPADMTFSHTMDYKMEVYLENFCDDYSTWLVFRLRHNSCVHCLHLSPEILLAIFIPSSPFSFRRFFRFIEVLSVCQRII